MNKNNIRNNKKNQTSKKLQKTPHKEINSSCTLLEKAEWYQYIPCLEMVPRIKQALNQTNQNYACEDSDPKMIPEFITIKTIDEIYKDNLCKTKDIELNVVKFKKEHWEVLPCCGFLIEAGLVTVVAHTEELTRILMIKLMKLIKDKKLINPSSVLKRTDIIITQK
jgi:hypothetical protein